MEFGDYHIGQVLENAPCIASMKDILKYIEIWRINHAIEIHKVMKGIFPDLQDETLPDISDKEIDILEDEEDGDDWMRILDESYVEEDFTCTPAYPDILDNALSSVTDQ